MRNLWRFISILLIASCGENQYSSLIDHAEKKFAVNSVAVEKYRADMKIFMSDPVVKEGWGWFMYRAHGFEATPSILIRLLPDIDSVIWGAPEEKFSRFGHYVVPGDEGLPLPSSLSNSSFPTKESKQTIAITTETCGTCHMGRVRLTDTPQGEILYLYGGVNVKFDIRKWRTALEVTVSKHLNSEAAIVATAKRLREAVASKPEKYFASNAQEDMLQRNFFMARGGAEKMLNEFVASTAIFTKSKRRQRDTSYLKAPGTDPPDIDVGQPGQVDASGDLLAQRLPLDIGMPAAPSFTDIPSIWMQSEYASGQWDGSVSSQFIRNLAAQVAVVPGSVVDRRVAHGALSFVTDLSAPVFPFKSENGGDRPALLEKGKKIFNENCADCHQARNDKLYPQIGTDMKRATVMTKPGGLLIAKIFYDACHSELPDGSPQRECGNFLSSLRDTEKAGGPAYPAKPLTGVWARAPYLHNGSIPTLRHLLVPKLRPKDFMVGSLSYDAENVGYQWQKEKMSIYRKLDPDVSFFDTRQDSLSNKGHDQVALHVDGKSYRLNWDDDDEAVEALLEFLRTL